jgi:hypothetical protein
MGRFAPGGSQPADTGSDDETVRVWDPRIGEQLAILEGDQGWVNASLGYGVLAVDALDERRRAKAQSSVGCALGSSPCDGCSGARPGRSPDEQPPQRPSAGARCTAAHPAGVRHRALDGPPEALRWTARGTERSAAPTFGYSPPYAIGGPGPPGLIGRRVACSHGEYVAKWPDRKPVRWVHSQVRGHAGEWWTDGLIIRRS